MQTFGSIAPVAFAICGAVVGFKIPWLDAPEQMCGMGGLLFTFLGFVYAAFGMTAGCAVGYLVKRLVAGRSDRMADPPA